MASEIEICNLALSHVRAKSINTLTEASKEAQNCALYYDTLRDMMLEDYNWNFANSITPLSQLTDVDRVFGWAYAYKYPPNCLRINRLVLDIEAVTYGQGAASHRFCDGIDKRQSLLRANVNYKVFINDALKKVIATNEPNLRVDYRRKITDPNLFTLKFSLALSHLLASYIAVPIVGDKIGSKYKSDNLALYNSMAPSAAADGMNESHEEVPESSYVGEMF